MINRTEKINMFVLGINYLKEEEKIKRRYSSINLLLLKEEMSTFKNEIIILLFHEINK